MKKAATLVILAVCAGACMQVSGESRGCKNGTLRGGEAAVNKEKKLTGTAFYVCMEHAML